MFSGHRSISFRLVISCLTLINFGLSPMQVKAWQDTRHDLRAGRYESYEDIERGGLLGEVLVNVISRGGLSKHYDDLLSLDGGTVGIAHFAVGGLANLYRQMDTEKYFKRSKEEMIAMNSSACRPRGKKGNDTGWGCYSKEWWREGMKAFLSSPESKEVQDEAWGSMMKPVIERVMSKGWTSARQLAIALGIANSLGRSGFESLAARHGWDAESTLRAYVSRNAHRRRREEALNQAFPNS